MRSDDKDISIGSDQDYLKMTEHEKRRIDFCVGEITILDEI